VASRQELWSGVLLEVEADCRRPLDNRWSVLVEYYANDWPVVGQTEFSNVLAIRLLKDPHLAASHIDDIPFSAKKPICGTTGLFGGWYDVTLVLHVTLPPRQTQFTGAL